MKITDVRMLCLSRIHEPENQWIVGGIRAIKADGAIYDDAYCTEARMAYGSGRVRIRCASTTEKAPAQSERNSITDTTFLATSIDDGVAMRNRIIPHVAGRFER